MKRLSKFLLISVLAMAFGVSCAKKSTSKSQNSGPVPTCVGDECIITPPDGGRDESVQIPDVSSWGAAGELNFTNSSSFQDFTGSDYGLEVIKDRFIYFDLEKDEDTGTYLGNMHILFKIEETSGGFAGDSQTAVRYVAPKFITGVRETDVQFNRVYLQNESGEYKKYFIAFFEEPGSSLEDDSFFQNWPLLDYGRCDSIQCFNIDQTQKRGSLLIVIDNFDDIGYSGKIYYKNWRAQNPQPHKPQQFGNPQNPNSDVENLNNRCWHISAGPYQCQEFVHNGKTRPDLGIRNRIREYELLGSFEKVNSNQLVLDF